jgi:predicted nucleotidyltransferase component of viral defense system
MFGSEGRFSQDIDLDAPHKNGFEAAAETALLDRSPFHGITFRLVESRWSEDGDENFSGTVEYDHADGSGRFELQISYRLNPVLKPCDLVLVAQEYLPRVEFDAPTLHGLDLYEMIGEKIMACNRRQGGSAKDIYDLYLWSASPFDGALVRRAGRKTTARAYDAMIAAIAVANDLPVYTCNAKDFSGIGELDVISVPNPEDPPARWIRQHTEGAGDHSHLR